MATREDEENQGFTVKDQRRFNPDGSLRDEPAEPEAPPPASTESGPDSAGEPQLASDRSNQDSPGEAHFLPADFATLILSLASSAQISLGVSPHPGTGQMEKNLIQAKHAIDLLGVLEEKTRGNLTPEEAQLLQAVLSDLRMRFVETKKES